MAEQSEDAEAPAKKSLSLPVTIAGAAALAIASGAAAFALAPAGGGGKDAHGGKEAAAGHGDAGTDGKAGHGDKSKDKKSKKKGGKGHGDKGKGGVLAGADGLSYVPLEPLIVSLGPDAKADRLKITLVIESAPGYEDDLVALTPKFRDVLNTYLRAVEARDFETPAAMARIRAHIIRRLRLVAPDGAVAGVLVTDFILD